MKVSQNWLKNLVEINSTPEDLSEKLSIGGFEVESLENCSKNVNGVVLGKVLSVLKHEGSDKLSICQVDIGHSNNLQIICGASNIKTNIYVYVATVGAKLNAVDLTIKRSEIRGVMSEGMICSLQELGLEDSSDGIEIIDEELALKYKLGTPGSILLQLNDYIYVTGEHKIFNTDNTDNSLLDNYIPVKDYKDAIKTGAFDNVLYCLITDNHQIPIGEFTFWDWED